MSFAEFEASTTRDAAPQAEWTPALRALWHDAREEWTLAHEQAQGDDSANGAWVHAYLHRKEGDLNNASYWYAKAGRSRPADDVTLPGEWEQIARALLGEPAAR